MNIFDTYKHVVRSLLRFTITKINIFVFNFLLKLSSLLWIVYNRCLSIFINTNTQIRYDHELKGYWIGDQINAAKCIFYLHGGARISGTPLMHIDALNKIVTLNSEIVIFTYDYPLVNCSNCVVHKQIDSCIDTYKKIIDELGVSQNNIVLMGDSAGGTIVLDMCFKLNKHYQPSKLILISPWVDIDDVNYDVDDIITCDYIKKCVDIIIPSSNKKYGLPRNNYYYLSPLRLDDKEIIDKIPRIMLCVGTQELFYNQIKDFHKKFSDKIDVFISDESIHIYPLLTYYDIDKSDEILKIFCDYILV